MKIPDNFQKLLRYKQEPTCHAGWITTASAYLRLLSLSFSKLDNDQKFKLQRIVSNIVSVYTPSFLKIHLKPSAAEGPGNTLFQRHLLFAYREINAEFAKVVLKYFYEDASRWLGSP